MQILIVKFESGLPECEVRELLRRRVPLVMAMPGLLQKYYARETSTGDYVGVHLFDSENSMAHYRNSELARSVPRVYQTVSPPRVEMLDVLFPLRREPSVLQMSPSERT